MKPCPFCNSINIEKIHDDGRFWCRCKACGSTGPATSKYEGEEDNDYCDWDTRNDPYLQRLERFREVLNDNALFLIHDQLTLAFNRSQETSEDLVDRLLLADSMNAVRTAQEITK